LKYGDTISNAPLTITALLKYWSFYWRRIGGHFQVVTGAAEGFQLGDAFCRIGLSTGEADYLLLLEPTQVEAPKRYLKS